MIENDSARVVTGSDTCWYTGKGIRGNDDNAVVDVDSGNFNHLVVNTTVSLPSNSLDTLDMDGLAIFVQNNDDDPRSWSDIADTCDAHNTNLSWSDVGDTASAYAENAKGAIRDTVEAIIDASLVDSILIFPEFHIWDTTTSGSEWVNLWGDAELQGDTLWPFMYVETESTSDQNARFLEYVQLPKEFLYWHPHAIRAYYKTKVVGTDTNAYQIRLRKFRQGEVDTSNWVASTNWTFVELDSAFDVYKSWSGSDAFVLDLRSRTDINGYVKSSYINCKFYRRKY